MFFQSNSKQQNQDHKKKKNVLYSQPKRMTSLLRVMKTPTTTTTNSGSNNTNATDADTLLQAAKKWPDVYMYHYDGGYMSRSSPVPTWSHGSQPSRFKVVPLLIPNNESNDENNDKTTNSMTGKPMVLSSPIQSRLDFTSMLQSIVTASSSAAASTSSSNNGSTIKVAILDEYGKYISCRTKFVLTNSALAEYRTKLGQYEQFDLEYCVSKGTFAFKSHNGLYLHYNKQLGTIAFKSKESADLASWIVHPLGLLTMMGGNGADGENDDNHNKELECIIFCGVVDKDCNYLIQRTTEGVIDDEWKTDFDEIIKCIIDELPTSSASIFQHPITNHHWCVAKYDEASVAVVVTSEGYPPALAAECHDDLTLVYKNIQDPKNVQRIEKLGLDRDTIVGKELAALMVDYNEQYLTSITRTSKLTKTEEEIQQLQQKMGENIIQIQQNIVNTEELANKTDELLEMSKLFKRQTSKLPKGNGWRNTTILLGTGVGAGAGALVGWLVGGPGGALILATEGMEIGVAAVTAGILGGTIAASQTISFWSRKYVHFTYPRRLQMLRKYSSPAFSSSTTGKQSTRSLSTTTTTTTTNTTTPTISE